jgi:hypothetical protein
MAPGQLTDPSPQLLLLNGYQWQGTPLGVAVLARQSAGASLGKPELILQNHDGCFAP